MQLGGEFFGSGPAIRPFHWTDPKHHAQDYFLRAVAAVAPEVLVTFESDVAEAARGAGTRLDDPESLFWLSSHIRPFKEAWQARWNLRETWVSTAADFTLWEWLRLDGRTIQDVWPAMGGLIRELDDYDAQDFTITVVPWIPGVETRAAAEARLRGELEDFLRRHLNGREREAEAVGMMRTPTKRARRGQDPNAHFEWLARFQVQEWSYSRIASHYDVSRRAVEDAVRLTAELIDLTRRTVRARTPPPRIRPP